MPTDWKDMIAGCFGSADRIFAGHPSDKERAIDLLQKCNKDSISLSSLIQEVENYLKDNLDFNAQTTEIQNNMQNHINGQLQDIKEKFEHWLN